MTLDPVVPAVRTTITMLLAFAFFGAWPLAGMAVMGDPGGVGRSAVLRRGPSLVVVSATCAGERLRSLRVASVDAATGRSDVVWAIAGDGTMPSEVTVGVTPDGLTTGAPFLAALSSGVIEVELETSMLHNVNRVRVVLTDLDDGQVHGAIGTYRDPGLFRRAALSGLSCDDPYGDRRRGRISTGILAVGALCGLASLVVRATRPRYGAPHVPSVDPMSRGT